MTRAGGAARGREAHLARSFVHAVRSAVGARRRERRPSGTSEVRSAPRRTVLPRGGEPSRFGV